jgi:hypothetical protein
MAPRTPAKARSSRSSCRGSAVPWMRRGEAVRTDGSSLAILSRHRRRHGRTGGVLDHQGPHSAHPRRSDLALLCNVALPQLQNVHQGKPDELVASPVENVPQMRARSNEALAVGRNVFHRPSPLLKAEGRPFCTRHNTMLGSPTGRRGACGVPSGDRLGILWGRGVSLALRYALHERHCEEDRARKRDE